MTIWFLRGVFTGVVTSRYPAAPEPSTNALPSPPVFRADLVDGDLAEALERCCPNSALRRDNHDLVYDIGRCTGCGRCLSVAGPAARPSGVVELAAVGRNDLVRRIPIRSRDEH
jgi:hypothetical protein